MIASASKPRSGRLVRGLSRLVNPLVLRFAGTRLVPLYGVLTHRGRRSGNVFHTPVVVRPTPDGFLVPMPWGEGTDWFRNVRAAGHCAIRWRGRDYHLVDPTVISAADAAAAFDRRQARMLARFGIAQCVRLRFAA